MKKVNPGGAKVGRSLIDRFTKLADCSASTGRVRAGMTPSEVARIFMVALMVLGPYLGMMFPVATVAAAEDPQPPKATSSVYSGPTPNATCNAQLTFNDEKGIFGPVFARGSRQNYLGDVQVNLYEVLSNGTSQLTAQTFKDAIQQNYFIFNGVTSSKLYVLEFVGTPSSSDEKPLKSYYDFHESNSPLERYNINVATRIWLDDQCYAYAIIDPASNNNYFTTPLTIFGQSYTGVKLTTGAGANDRTLNGVITKGRGVGGRVFTEDGSSNPVPLYKSGASVRLYPVINNGTAITTTGFLEGFVDDEGFYTAAGVGTTDQPYIKSNVITSYIMELRAPGFNPLFYCNYVYPNPDPVQNSLTPALKIDFQPGAGDDVYLTTAPSAASTKTPPCKSASGSSPIYGQNGSLAGAGYHHQVRVVKKISGTVNHLIDPTNPGSGFTAAVGTVVIAYRANTNVAQNSSDPVGSDGQFTIDNLSPNTAYKLEFVPPSGQTFIGEYYNNKTLDVGLGGLSGGDLVTTNAAAGAQITSVGTVTLDPGWFFAGRVSSLSGGTGVAAQVSIYEINPASPNDPSLVDTVTTDANGDYVTTRKLLPGKTYAVNVRPTAGNFTAAWCGTRNGSGLCTTQPSVLEAEQILIVGSTDRSIGIKADIKLAPGVLLAGTISATDINNAVYSLGPNTTVGVYVYKVDMSSGVPTNPALVQQFDVQGSGSTYSYQTAALFTNVNYAVRFVPVNTPPDQGYASAYYDSANLRGRPNLITTSQVISKPTANLYTGYDIALLRAGAIQVKLYNSQGLDFSGVKVEVYGNGQARGSGTPAAIGVTDNNGQVFLPRLDPSQNYFRVYFYPPGQRGVAQYYITVSNQPQYDVTVLPNQTTYITFTMPPFAGFSGSIFPSTNNWTGSKLLVLDSQRRPFGLYTENDGTGIFQLTQQGNTWFWDAFLAPGTYYFGIVPSTTQTYVPHYYVAPGANAANPNEALSVTGAVNNPRSGLDITFSPGGVMRLEVKTEAGVPLNGAGVTFFKGSGFTSPLNSDTSRFDGSAYSIPYVGPVIAKVTAPAGSESEDGQLDNGGAGFSLSNGQILTKEIKLKYTPFISGYVKVRSFDPATNTNSEVGLANVRVVAVNASDTSIELSSQPYFTNAAGYYELRMPIGQFKLQFKPASTYETRYWFNTPQQNGTPDPAQANVIQRVNGVRYNNYNLIYDDSLPTPTPTPPAQGCRITDLYVMSTGVSTATIRYFTNCKGTTQLGYSLSQPLPNATSISSYPMNTSVTDTTNGGVFTHTVTISSLQADKNYYIRPYSQMTPPGSGTPTGNVVGADAELLARTSSDGKNWFFATGDTTSSATVSTTEMLHLFNYGTQSANVTINYYTQAGMVAPVVNISRPNITVPAGARVDIPVQDSSNPNSLGNGNGYQGVHSIKVTSDQNLVVEKSQSLAAPASSGYRFSGSYSIPGASAASNIWWLAEVSKKPAIEQIVSIFNPSSAVSVCVSLDYFKASGGVLTRPSQPDKEIVVRPNGRFDFKLSDPDYGPNTAGITEYGLKVSTYTNSDGNGVYCQQQGIVVEEQTRYVEPTSQAYHKGVTGQMAIPGSSQRWFFLDGQTDKAYDIVYTVANPGAGAATITLTAYIENPTTGVALTWQKVFPTQVPANGVLSYTIPYTEFNKAAPGQRFGFTVRMDSNKSVVAQRSVRYLYSVSPEMRGLYHQAGATRASTQWLFAAGDTMIDNSTQRYTEEALNVYNPNPYETTLKVTYYYSSTGSTVAPPSVFNNFKLAAYSRVNIQPSATPDSGGTYPAIGANKLVAVKIEEVGADGGVFAERLVYSRNGPVNGGNAVYGWNPPGS